MYPDGREYTEGKGNHVRSSSVGSGDTGSPRGVCHPTIFVLGGYVGVGGSGTSKRSDGPRRGRLEGV